MKVHELLAEYLYQQHQLTLPRIGHFQLNSNINLHELKDHPLPVDAIEFTFDPHATEDPALIAFLAKHTGKMKSLTSSDLESYISQGIQLLNIGKPFFIKGVGNLFKTQHGTYVFEVGQIFIEPHVAVSEEYVLHDRTKQAPAATEDIDFSHPPQRNQKWRIITVGFIMTSILIAWSVYFMMRQENKAVMADNEPTEDTTLLSVTPSPNYPTDTVATTSVPISDSSNLTPTLIVILENFTNPKRAQQRYEQLKSYGHEVKLLTQDSSFFTLQLYVHQPVADTARLKDSLTRLFGKPVSFQ